MKDFNVVGQKMARNGPKMAIGQKSNGLTNDLKLQSIFINLVFNIFFLLYILGIAVRHWPASDRFVPLFRLHPDLSILMRQTLPRLYEENVNTWKNH